MSQTALKTASIQSFSDQLKAAKTQLLRVLSGKESLIDYSIATFLAGGHLLLEGPPGTGKTSLARGLAQVFGGQFRRVQMTSDLLPSDIVGMLRLKPGSSEFEFRKGPIFTNFLLADELNRTGPKTQSALLEGMAEGTVTIDGVAHLLPEPFFVVATQNPLEFQGVYPLAESQLDRFMIQLTIDLPCKEDELKIYQTLEEANAIYMGTQVDLQTVLSLDSVRSMKQEISAVHIEKSVLNYGHEMIQATRSGDNVYYGASVRAGIQFFAAAKALAYLRGRNFVVPDDLRDLAVPVLSHRMSFLDGSRDTIQKQNFIKSFLDRIKPPR